MKRFYASKSTFSYLYLFTRYGSNKKSKIFIKTNLNLNKNLFNGYSQKFVGIFSTLS